MFGDRWQGGDFESVRRTQHFPASVAVQQIEAMEHLFFRLAENGVVPSALGRQSLRLRRFVEIETKEMTFARIGTAGHDNGTIGFVEVDELLETKIGLRDRAHERAIGRMQFDLPRAVALGGPKKSAAILQPDRHWLVIEIQPRSIFFAEQLARRA